MAQSGWPELNGKRSRGEDCTLGFEEHRNKRFQTLPLRTSPSSKRHAGPPRFPPSYPNFTAPPPPPHTITPGDSDSEDPNASHAQPEPQTWADCPELIAQQPSPNSLNVDNDMDMMDAMDSEPASHDGYAEVGLRLAPGSMQPDPIAPSITGRMPTPIHATFVAQVRGNNWGGAAGNIMGPPAVEALNASAFGSNAQYVTGHESVPRSLDGASATASVMADWSMLQNRRLPSPISESGGEDILGSPTMVLDASMGQVNQHGHMHPMLSGLPPRANSAIELGQLPRPSEPSSPPRASTPGAGGSPNGNSHDGSAMDVETSPSPRKGHTRSRHTVNSWTAAQPGMKKSFSIGYRADCEKCRQKVPGHFNHIIIS